jgi:membrane protease subunit HflK
MSEKKDPWGMDRYNFKMPNFNFKKSLILPVLLIIIVLWALTGIYIVDANQQAVVKRFGKISKVVGPGPHYHFPYPVETVNKADVTDVHRLEIGYRTYANGETKLVENEAQMLTGDENIVNLDVIVQYRIGDIVKYMYNIDNVLSTIKQVSESSMREIVGKRKIDYILTVGKSEIQIKALEMIQNILNDYESGIQIVAVQLQDVNPPDEVVSAFRDVASAREDKSRLINEAQSYVNKVIPQARGEAAAMILNAEAYKEEKVQRAKGDAEKFTVTLKSYKQSPKLTRERLYLEKMQTVISKGDFHIFDSQISNINTFIGLENLKRSVK